MLTKYLGHLNSTGEGFILGVMSITAQVTGLTSTGYTLNQALEAVPELEPEATYFVWSADDLSKMLEIGFTNVFNLDDFANGEKITFNTGSYLLFTKTVVSPTRTDYDLEFFDETDTRLSGFGGNSLNTGYVYSLCSNTPLTGTTNAFKSASFYLPTSTLPVFRFVNSQFPNMSGFGTASVNVWENIENSDDPYGFAGDSTTGGGFGTFTHSGTAVGFPNLPTLSAVDTGLVTLYNPTLSQINSLASFLWAGAFDVDSFKKLFTDPMQAIIGLSIVPVSVPSSGSAVSVKIGNIDSGVAMYKASTQYVSLDCGSLNIREYWGSYLDYNPYTKFDLYLPYIGFRSVSADVLMQKSVHLKYFIDIFSGACVACLMSGGSVMYSFIGQCATNIPITNSSWNNTIGSILTIAGAVGSMVATGGATAPMSAGMIASAGVNAFKQDIQKSGSMSGTGGMLGVQTPYFVFTYPRQAKPENQNYYSGYPSFVTYELGTLSGYTEVDTIHLENIPATQEELNEIETLLKGGVLL